MRAWGASREAKEVKEVKGSTKGSTKGSRRARLLWSLIPVIGLAFTIALIAQARGFRGKIAAGAPEAPAHQTSAAPAVAPARISAEGRLASYPGAQVDVGTEVRGTLARVLVAEKDPVRKGELLAELRNDDLKAQIVEARARVSEAEADTRLYQADLDRMEALRAHSVASQQSLDGARRNHDAAIARQAVAEAEVVRLEAELAKTRIVSPIDGVLIARIVQPGETVDAGAMLFTIADLSRIRVEAEIDEFDAGRVDVGSPVVITAEGYDGRSWRGAVEEIPDQVIPRRLRPEDPAKPGDTRVLHVKIAVADPAPLKLGQRVEVAIG